MGIPRFWYSSGMSISEKAKARWADPEFRKRISEKLKLFWADKANKKRMQQAAVASWEGRDDRRAVVAAATSLARRGTTLSPEHRQAISHGLATSDKINHPIPKLTREELKERTRAAKQAKWHLCQCSQTCQAMVKSERFYARGHSPASHTEERDRKATETIVRRFLSGELHNPSGDDNVSKRPEVRQKISDFHRGKPKSEEHRDKISESKTGVPLSSEHKAAVSAGLLGHEVTDVTRAFMSKSTTKARASKFWASIPKGTILDHPAWNKGLTKETDSRVAEYSEKLIGHPIHSYGHYPYGGKVMRCTWEVAYAMSLDKQGVAWEYEEYVFPVGKGPWRGVTYRPDFYLIKSRTFVEIKGAWLNGSEAKIKKFRKLYPKVKLKVFTQMELIKMGILNEKGKVPFRVEKI